MTMQQWAEADTAPWVKQNENFETLEHQAVYGKRQTVTTGLTWGYYGGRWGGFSVADGTLALTASQTNYVVVLRADGVISVSTTSTNWDNATDYARVYKIITGASGVTGDPEDHRSGPGGAHGGGAAAVAAEYPAINPISGTTHSMVAADAGTYMRFTNSATKTLTVQDNADEALSANTEYHGRNVGAGALTIAEDTAVTINVPTGGTLVIPQGGTFTLKRVATDEFDLIGVTVAA